MQVVDLGRRRRGQLDEFFQAEPALRHHGVEQQRQPRLQARHAVGDLLEVRVWARHELARFVERVGRVIRRDGLQVAAPERRPQRLLVGLVAQRRAAHPFGALGPAGRDRPR